MKEKRTTDLENVLGKTHLNSFQDYCKNNQDSIASEANSFSVYVKDILYKNHITQQMCFLRADIPEKYGYKLLSGEKRTKQRDIILRICYAANMTLEETQRALRKYELPELYAKIPRDALLMIVFNDRPGSVLDVNQVLLAQNMMPLRTSSLQD